MGSPYVGEIRIFGGNFAPLNWAFCNGQSLPISSYETLYNLIGTTYGGNGQTTFNLPNLMSQFPVHMGTNQGTPYVLGSAAGTPTVTLTTQQIPLHTHTMMGQSAAGTLKSPASNSFGGAGTMKPYTPSAPVPADNLAAAALGNAGGSLPHENVQPYLAVNFIISLFGIYPPQP